MAELKSLIVNGITRLNNTGYAKNLYADKFITNGGTAQQYVKGDGTLGNISDFSGSGHNHDARYLRKDTNDSTAYQYSFTKVNDHAIKVGTVRGTAVGSLTGEYIHLYERVHIGSPAGWGSRNAPSYGLSTYGGAWLATDTGNVGIGTTSPQSKLHVNGTSNLAGDTTIGTKSFYYQRSTRGAIHHEFVGNDADYGAVKIIHQSGEGSGGPGGFTASLGIFDERPATISGAYQPTFFINRTGATYVPDLIGVNNSAGRVFTITSYGNLFTGNLSIDNTAFTNSVTIFANQNDETGEEYFTESKPSWGITFKRQWNSGTANTTSAGIYAVGSVNWRTGLAFRVKNNTTNTGSHDLTAMWLSPAGRIGIGTTSPSAKFHIVQASTGGTPYGTYIYDTGNAWAMRSLTILCPNLTNGSSPFINIGKADSAYNFGWIGYVHSSDGSTSNRLSFGLHSVDNVLNILGTGYVGIGTTSPSQKLHVNGNTKTNKLLVSTDSSTALINTLYNNFAINFREGRSYDTGFFYGTYGNEFLALTTQQSVTSLIFGNGYDPASITSGSFISGDGTNYTYGASTNVIQIKQNCVNIGDVWKHNITPDYKLKINGTTYINDYLRVSGGIARGSEHILSPAGGSYTNNNSSVTGYIIIRFPHSLIYTMMSIWIDVYSYSTNKSFTIQCGAYTYDNSFGDAPFAMCIGAQHKVRYCYDADYYYIVVGESNTGWSYPKFMVRDMLVGFSRNVDNWIDKSLSCYIDTTLPGTEYTSVTRYTYTIQTMSTTSVAGLYCGDYSGIYVARSSNETMSLSTTPAEGSECHIVIYNNGSSNITITLPTSYRRSVSSIIIAPGSFGEVSVLTINSIVHIRAI